MTLVGFATVSSVKQAAMNPGRPHRLSPKMVGSHRQAHSSSTPFRDLHAGRQHNDCSRRQQCHGLCPGRTVRARGTYEAHGTYEVGIGHAQLGQKQRDTAHTSRLQPRRPDSCATSPNHVRCGTGFQCCATTQLNCRTSCRAGVAQLKRRRSRLQNWPIDPQLSGGWVQILRRVSVQCERIN